MTHICVSDLTTIGSDNGLSPCRRQAIIRTNAGILLIRPLGTNFSEILIEILSFSITKMRLKVSSAKRRPFSLGLNVLCDNDWRQDVRNFSCMVASWSVSRKYISYYKFQLVSVNIKVNWLQSGFKSSVITVWMVPASTAATRSSHMVVQYIPRNMHMVLLCFALLWLRNHS